MARNRRKTTANATATTRSSTQNANKAANAPAADKTAGSANDDSNDDGPSPGLVTRLINARDNDDVGPELLKDGNPYIYMRVPFGFPPWYVDSKAESSDRLWTDLGRRHNIMSARVTNMNVAMAQLNSMRRCVRPGGDGEDGVFFRKKIDDVNDALGQLSDMRKGSPVLLSQKPIQLLTFVEDSLWMAMGCLCRILDAKLPQDVDGVDPEWEGRLRGLMESVAV